MSHYPALIRVYLEKVVAALSNEQTQEAASLAQHAVELLNWSMPVPSSSSFSAYISYGVGLDTGIQRAGSPNEDYAFATAFPTGGGLFIIADGMGGHAHGADASHLAVHTAVDYILPHLLHGSSIQEDAIPALLVQAVQAANQAIYLQNVECSARTQQARMGTTISVAVSLGSRLYVANVGDSRTYLLHRGKKIQQITRDHSVVGDLLIQGKIRAEEVYTHPQRNLIYRSLGEQKQITVDTFYEHIEDGDMVLLCSDGLWEMLPEARLIEEVLSSPLDVEQMTRRLVHLACDNGGHDNIGVVVAQVRFSTVQDMPTMLLIPPQSPHQLPKLV